MTKYRGFHLFSPEKCAYTTLNSDITVIHGLSPCPLHVKIHAVMVVKTVKRMKTFQNLREIKKSKKSAEIYPLNISS